MTAGTTPAEMRARYIAEAKEMIMEKLRNHEDPHVRGIACIAVLTDDNPRVLEVAGALIAPAAAEPSQEDGQ